MDNQLAVFEGKHEVMVLFPSDVKFTFKGDFLICAKNVAKVLEYSRTEEVTKFCKKHQLFLIKNSDISDSAKHRIRKINNAGEYFVTNLSLNRILGKSEKPKAEKFQDWLYEEVIPSIQKHGGYLTPAKIEEVLLNPDTIIDLAKRLKQANEEKAKLQTENLVLKQQNNEMKPKASYYDLVLQNKSLLSVSKIAKDYGMSARALNKKLHELGVQYKQGDIWLLYAKYQDKGYTQTNTYVIDADKSRVTTKWTQKGRLFIYELLKKNGILPLIERNQSETG